MWRCRSIFSTGCRTVCLLSRRRWFEPVSIAFHAINLTPISLNDSVVVIGAGMVGLFVVQALRAAGCGTIIAVDIEQNKLDMALKLGADHGLLAGQVDVPEAVRWAD